MLPIRTRLPTDGKPAEVMPAQQEYSDALVNVFFITRSGDGLIQQVITKQYEESEAPPMIQALTKQQEATLQLDKFNSVEWARRA